MIVTTAVVLALAGGFGCGWWTGRRRQEEEVERRILQRNAERLAQLSKSPTRPRLRQVVRSPRDANAPPERKDR